MLKATYPSGEAQECKKLMELKEGSMRFSLEVLLALILSGLGVSAAVVGAADDARGLVGIGCLLAAAAVGLGVRAGWRGATARLTDDVRGG